MFVLSVKIKTTNFSTKLSVLKAYNFQNFFSNPTFECLFQFSVLHPNSSRDANDVDGRGYANLG